MAKSEHTSKIIQVVRRRLLVLRVMRLIRLLMIVILNIYESYKVPMFARVVRIGKCCSG